MSTPRTAPARVWTLIAVSLATFMTYLDNNIVNVAIRGLKARLERPIGIIWHRDRLQSRAAEAFVQTAMQVSLDVDMPAVPSMSSAA